MTIAVSDYLHLITSQYQNSPKFLSWLESALKIPHDISICAEAMPGYFDLDLAVGVQLDIVGLILGQSRTLTFQPTDGTSSILDDATYRKVLKLKALTNYWKGTQGEIYRIWNTIFPEANLLIADHQDMSATIYINGTLSQIVIDMINNDLIIPRPEGVRYFLDGVVTILPIFSYDKDDDFFKGYDEAVWESTLG